MNKINKQWFTLFELGVSYSVRNRKGIYLVFTEGKWVGKANLERQKMSGTI